MTNPRYDPFKHHRRSVRYTDWDYRTPSYYFVTVCTVGRQNLFDDQAILIVAKERLLALLTYDNFQHVTLDEWVIMPNHAHFILWLMRWPESILHEPEKRDGFANAQSGSVGSIVGTYKSQVTRRINKMNRQMGVQFWQSGYWDRIIRNEKELNKTRQYIIDNPIRWDEDRDNLDILLNKMTFHE